MQFLPTSIGSASSILTLTTSNGGNPYQLAVTAAAVPTQGLLLTPASQDFGTVPVGSTSAPLTFTLANLLTPAVSATIEGVAVTGDFSVVANTNGGQPCTASLASTASCYLTLSFSPTTTGPRSGTLTVTTASGIATAALTGSAVANPGLAISPTSLTFSAQPGSTSVQGALTLTNTGSFPFSFGPFSLSNPSFTASSTCATLAPAASCPVTVAFTPGSSDAAATLSFPVTSTADGQQAPVIYTVPLSGAYTASEAGLLLLPSQVNFGAQATGSLGQTRQFTLQNTSSATETVALTVPQQFPLATPFACATLAAGATCTFSVSFLPETGGALTGSLVATATSAGGSASQALGYLLGYGAASGTLVVSGQPIPDAPVSFGQVTSGQTAQQTLTLTNSGSGPLTIRGVATSPPFLAATTCGEPLAPAAACTVTVTYAPLDDLPPAAASLAPRTDTGILTIASDAASSPEQLDLTGTAVPVLASDAATSPVTSYTLSQGALTFANTQVGDSSPAQTLTLTNNGTATLSIGAVLAPTDYAASTDCATLAPAATCTVAVSFLPGSATTASLRAGTLEILSNASNPLNFVTLLGISSAAPLTLSPASLAFGTLDLGHTAQLSVTATNTASLPITFGQLTTTGDFSVAPGSCPAPDAPLPAGQSCTALINFTPTAVGIRTGTLSVVTNATEFPLTVALTGAAVVSDLQITPGNLAFGSLSVGAPAVLPVTLSNVGTASVTGLATAISGPDAADFALTAPCRASMIAAAAGCGMQITFTPSATGPRSATLTLTSSDPSSPASILLTGTGIQAGSFALTVAGSTSATTSIGPGAPATFPLLLTPLSGYTGTVALTCTAVVAGPYAACSLLNPQLTLSGGPMSAAATITTIGGVSSSRISPLGILLLSPLTLLLRRNRRSGFGRLFAFTLVLAASFACLSLTACGGGATTGQGMTPPGVYQYLVTASSTNGLQVSSSVTLNLVVQ